MTDALTPIRKMCDAYGVTARTLRFYEAEGLLAPVRRGTSRWYTQTDHARLTVVLRGRRYAMSIDEIRGLMALWDPQTACFRDMGRVCAIGRRQLDVLHARRATLDDAITALRRDLDDAAQCLERKTAA